MAETAAKAKPLVGVQIGPISFIDEGVEPCLDTLQAKGAVNTLMIGTVSWLGLKVGRLVCLSTLLFPRGCGV